MSEGNEEDLQKRVAELEATVRGLTEELVDATERIRQLEEEHGYHESAAEKREARTQQRRQEASTDANAETTTETPQPADGDAEAGKSEEPQSSDESEESDLGDDIIVA